MIEYNSSKHSHVVAEILRREQFKRFAEIGVLRSVFARSILRNGPPDLEEYWAVDPWSLDYAAGRKQKKMTEEGWFQEYWYCCNLMIHFPQLKVLKMASEDAARMFPDNYFDMVYIDANHHFKNAYADIGYWLPKVRDGGILGGHDYNNYHGVKKAVIKWFGEENIEVWERSRVWVKRIGE